jgi:hypothetical protein
MKWISAFFLICIFLCETPLIGKPTVSSGFLCIDNDSHILMDGLQDIDDHVFTVADSLYACGDYYASAIEYERAYFLSGDPFLRVVANLYKIQALKQLGEFEKARSDIQRSLPHADEPSMRLQVLYEWAFCAYMAGDYNEALLATQQVNHYYSDMASREKTKLIHALSVMQLEQWDSLSDFIDEWTSPYVFADEHTTSVNDIRDIVAELKQLLFQDHRPNIRSPERARTYSAIAPGLGHSYAGEYGKGGLNMLSQALSLGGAALLAINGYYISTFTVGLSLFQSFYFGGIKQAGRLTASRNEKLLDDYKQNLGGLLVDLDEHIQLVQSQTFSYNTELALEETLLALYDFNFRKADSITSGILIEYPEQYLSHVARTNYLWWQIISQPVSGYAEKQYMESIAQAMALANRKKEVVISDQDLFYLISMYAMQARLDLKNGAYIRAMRNGRNAISHFERSRGKEATFHGFLLTSGLYNYMTDQAARKYPFLRIYSIFYPEGNRELGLTQLRKASQSEYLIWSTEANYFLMRLYLEMEQDPDQALGYASWLTSTYPSNLIYQYYHLVILIELGNAQAINEKKAEIRSVSLSHSGITKEQRDYFLELIND